MDSLGVMSRVATPACMDAPAGVVMQAASNPKIRMGRVGSIDKSIVRSFEDGRNTDEILGDLCRTRGFLKQGGRWSSVPAGTAIPRRSGLPLPGLLVSVIRVGILCVPPGKAVVRGG